VDVEKSHGKERGVKMKRKRTEIYYELATAQRGKTRTQGKKKGKKRKKKGKLSTGEDRRHGRMGEKSR